MDEVIAEQAHPGADPAGLRQTQGATPGWTGGRYAWMRTSARDRSRPARLTENAYQLIEPVFGHTKHNRRFTRFHRRGRTAVRTEWRFLMATHNLTKLHRHQIATAGPENGPHADHTDATQPSPARTPHQTARRRSADPHDFARQRPGAGAPANP